MNRVKPKSTTRIERSEGTVVHFIYKRVLRTDIIKDIMSYAACGLRNVPPPPPSCSFRGLTNYQLPHWTYHWTYPLATLSASRASIRYPRNLSSGTVLVEAIPRCCEEEIKDIRISDTDALSRRRSDRVRRILTWNLVPRRKLGRLLFFRYPSIFTALLRQRKLMHTSTMYFFKYISREKKHMP